MSLCNGSNHDMVSDYILSAAASAFGQDLDCFWFSAMVNNAEIDLLAYLFNHSIRPKSRNRGTEAKCRHFPTLLMYIAKLLSKSKTVPINTLSSSAKERSVPPAASPPLARKHSLKDGCCVLPLPLPTV